MYVEKKHTQRLPHWIKDADGGKRHSSSPNTTTIQFDFHYLTCELYATDSSIDDETIHLVCLACTRNGNTFFPYGCGSKPCDMHIIA